MRRSHTIFIQSIDENVSVVDFLAQLRSAGMPGEEQILFSGMPYCRYLNDFQTYRIRHQVVFMN